MKRVLPAEWEYQDAIIIAWPNQFTDWKNNLPDVLKTYTEVANHISQTQLLIILSNQTNIKQFFNPENLKNIITIQSDYNDTWTRDYIGLSILINNKPTLLDFKFNGWGNKFEFEKDNKINYHLVEKGFISNIDSDFDDFILEGGSIESNGLGTILTTEKCLLNKNRNSELRKDQIEDQLKKSLGVKKIIWIKNGEIIGDDTDSHIDTLVRFCNTNTLVYSIDSSEELQKLEYELKGISKKENYTIIPIPLPSNKVFNKNKLPSTYVNFLITNNKVLVPTYNDPNDIKALKIFTELFPGREIIGIDSTALIKQGGSLHCITMQFYKNILTRPLR